MYLYIGMILLLCVLLFVLSLLFRKAKAEKICKMSCPQKLQIIENLLGIPIFQKAISFLLP